MDMDAEISWFAQLPEQTKIVLIARFIHDLTSEVRAHVNHIHEPAFGDYAYFVLETIRRLASAVSERLQGEPSYPDDYIVKMLLAPDERFNDQPPFASVWDWATRRFKNA